MVVRYRSGCLVLLLPFMLGAVPLFASATVNPEVLNGLAEVHGAGWLRLTSYLSVDGVNIPVAALTLLVTWELVKLIRRAWNHQAIISDAIRVTFHPTERIKVAAWSELEKVSHDEAGLRSDLLFTFKDGRFLRVRNCEQDDAQRFVELANSRLTPSAAPATPPAT